MNNDKMNEIYQYYLKLCNLEYGWYDTKGNLHEHIKPELFIKEFRLQDLDKIIEHNHAVCIECCELLRKYFNDNNIECKTLLINEDNTSYMHTTVVFILDNVMYLIETSFTDHKQIKEVNSYEELLNIYKKDFKYFDKDYDNGKISLYEYSKPKDNIGALEFFENALSGKKLL